MSVCPEYDHAALVTRHDGPTGPRVEWEVKPDRCHISTELASDPEAVAFIMATYGLSPGCRPDVLHADLRQGGPDA